MPHNLTYMFLNFSFFTPLFVVLAIFFRKTIRKNMRFIMASIIFAVVTFFLIDPIATYWNAWGYDYSQTLGLTVGKSVFEEYVWAILVCVVLAIVVSACAEREEKGEPFLNLTNLRKKLRYLQDKEKQV